MDRVAELSTVVAEIALALHPIIVKSVPVSIITHVLARLGTFTTLGAAFASPADFSASWGSADSIL